MKQAQRKSFDWYKMQQRFSIRKYHFGAASVLLGTALVLGAGAKVQTVQADEHYAEVTNSVSIDKIAEATKPVEVSTSKKETTYPAPTVVNPVEVTPAKSEAVKAAVEKVEEPKVEKEEVSHQSAVDKSKLLTALSRARKLDDKLYTEASAANLKASIQAGQGLLGKADASEAELSAAESSIQSAVIGLELRSNSDKGTVSETSVAKKANADEAEEETKQAPTTNRSALDSVVLPTSRAAIVEASSAPKTTNEILKPGLSLSDARQNPAIRKEDLEKGHSGFRAASNPANPIVSGSGNTVAFTDISQAGRSYSFRGYGNARGGHSIHYDVTTVRQGNRLNFTIQYSGPGEFVNNNFILDKGDGFGNPSNATITTPRLREQSKPISQGANFVSHSGYTMTSATETSMQQTIRFSLPINNPNGDLSVRLKPVTFNVDQGGGGAATSNDPYSNSNYYYRANPLYLDANPNGGSSNKAVTEDIDFQTVYLPTSKLPEGQTRLVREGEKGQRQITYKVHRFGNETILGLPISNSVTKEAKPRIMQIGVAKELIDTVKPRVDQNKVGDTNNLTFYLDNDGNGVYTEGVDELVQKIAIKDGAKGEKGDQGERGLTGAKGEKGDQGERGLTGAKGEKGDRGERGLTGAKGEKGDQGQAGRDGVTPTVTVKDNKDDGTHTITINDGRGNVTSTVVRDGFDGASPLVATQRNEADKTTTVIFYYDQNDNNEFDAGDTKLKEVVIADGAKGEKGDQGERGLTGAQGEKGDRGDRGETGAAGRDGKTPKVTTARGADGRSTDITFTVPGEEPVTVNIKDGKDGRTPTIDLNALAEAAARLNNQRSGRVRRALADAPSTAPAEKPREGTLITAYFDNNGNGRYDEGIDELIAKQPIYNGTDGANGAAGAAGRNGAELLSGPKPPTSNDGKDGDTYIDATTGDVYKKEGENWNQIGNIRGPQGLKGEAGVAGPQGPKGDQGAQGLQGPAGRDGAQGPAGRDGRDGAQGPAGRDGRDGKDVLNGKVNPTTEGKDGDKYVNTETGDVFVKNNGTWEKEGNIKGPKGDKGERGEDGKTPEVTVTPGKDGHSTDITFTVPGKDPVTVNVKNGENGLNGKTPKVDLLRVEGQNGNPSHTIVTFYTDENNDGKYTPGTDELLGSEMIKDGAKGADGRDGKSLLTVKDGKETKVYQEDPAHPGQPLNPEKPLAVIKDGVDGVSPTVTAVRKDEEGHKGVEITVDNHDGSQPTTVFVQDGAKGETGATGQDGQTPTITTQRGQDGQSTVVTITTPGKDPVTFTVKDGKNGKDGRTPTIDLNALVEAVRRGAGSTSNSQSSGTSRSARNRRALPDEDRSATESSETVQPTTTDATDSQPVNGTRITAYYDNNGNGKYDPGVDELIGTSDILNGTNGRNGTDGASGTNGRNGAELLSGVTAPTANDGKDGDTYIDANTGDVYKKENGSWNKIGNIRGPQGVAGEKGEKGENGANGADGKSPVVNVTDNGDGTHSITVRNPDGSESTTKVKDGKDGKTANITTTENPDGSHTITVTNPDGTTKETVVKNGKDGKTPKVEVTDNNDGTHTVKVTDGDGNVTNAVIKDGKDGKAATATTTENPDGSHRVTITNPDGTKNEFVVKNGRDGVDGRTPTASVRDNGDGSHTIVITNPEGVTTETTVHDGKSPKVTITDEQNGTHKISVLNGDGTTTETIIKDGKSPVATIKDNHDGTYTIRVENGNGTVSETTVRDGKSPTAKVVDNGDGTHTITVVNSDGTTTTTTVRDGKEPKLEVIDNNNGSHTIKVTGADGKETTTTIFDGKSPKANIVDNGDGTHTLTIVDSDGREYKSIIKDGKDGKDGVSPTVTVKNNNDGTHVVTITNPDGSKTEMVIKDGKDGKSPKVSVEDNGNGSHTITIINSDGTVTKTVVKDGKDGRDGKDGKDGKCGCQDKPVTPSNDKPVPPTPNVQEGPTFAMPEPPVHELPEFNGSVPGMPEVHELPEFNGGVPGMPEVNELSNPEVPGMPTPPVQEIPEFNGGVPGMPEVNDKPTSNIPEVPTQSNPNVPVQPVTPLTSNPVGPTTGKENHGDKLPETGSQSDYISVLLGSGILLSLYVGRRKED